MQRYTVVLGDDPVGTVELKADGLYYNIYGQCQLSGNVVCRLFVKSGDTTFNLGVLVPDHNLFNIRTRVARKKLNNGNLHFYINAQCTNEEHLMLQPLDSKEPFTYLESIFDCYLSRSGDQLYAFSKNPISNQLGSDRSQIHYRE